LNKNLKESPIGIFNRMVGNIGNNISVYLISINELFINNIFINLQITHPKGLFKSSKHNLLVKLR
jgi:hypothetical protein